MFRLTLRSSRDGRFLARVVDPGGYPFVLDFGDRRVIDDLTQRLLHGFTMWRWGKLLNVAAQSPEVMKRLAEYYAAEGVLVFLEEPTWTGRAHSLEDRLDGPGSPNVLLATADPLQTLPEHDAPTEIADLDDPNTEVSAIEDLRTEVLHVAAIEDVKTDVLNVADIYSVDDFNDPDTETEMVEVEDAPTEVADRSVLIAISKAAHKKNGSG